MSKLTADQIKLIEDNLEFCYWYFNRYDIYSEDTQQNMFLALCKYIHLYDSNRGNITTFISTVFSTASCRQFRKETNNTELANKLAISIDTPIVQLDGSEVTIADTLDSLDTGIDSVENRIVISNIIANLSKHKKVSNDDFMTFITFLKTGSLTLTGNIMNVTKECVRKRCNKIRNIIVNDNLSVKKLPRSLCRNTKLDCTDTVGDISTLVTDLCN